MAVNVNIYSNANSSSKSVSVDFIGEISAFSSEHIYSPTNAGSVEYYFKFTTGARQDDGSTFPVKIVRSLSELVLNNQKQRATNTANAPLPTSKIVTGMLHLLETIDDTFDAPTLPVPYSLISIPRLHFAIR